MQPYVDAPVDDNRFPIYPSVDAAPVYYPNFVPMKKRTVNFIKMNQYYMSFRP